MLRLMDIISGIRNRITTESMSRLRAEWMTFSDDRILAFLESTGAGHNYRGIEVNTLDRGDKISYSTIKRRVPKLLDVGLVRELEGEGNYYAITEQGEKYLAGDFDARELPDPDSSE